MMSERKGSLQLVSNSSAKYLNIEDNKSKQAKKHKYKGSLHKFDENYISLQIKSTKPSSINSHKQSKPLIDKSLNIIEHEQQQQNRQSFEESLLHKIRKLGFISQGTSKKSSPHKRKKNLNEIQTKVQNFISFNEPHVKYNFSKSLFNYFHVIGRGGFGKVWKVQLKRNKRIYALKEMSKALVISKKSVPSVMNQKKLLGSLKNDFLVNMIQAFQDRQSLYLVMDFLPGGDLRYHLAKKKRFSESQAKFIIACIFLGLEYLHKKNIIHRDIKPQNIVMDDKGYIRITDLGVARIYRQSNSSDTSGTPGYMAPQVLCRQNHTFSVDHFAMGVIAYQLMLRRRPYYGRNRKQIRDEVLSRQIQVKKHEIPEDWSLESADFINRLIQRKPSARLGFTSSQQIKKHPWLRQFNFQKLSRKQFQAPYKPDIRQISSKSHNQSSQNTEIKELISQNELLLREDQIQQLFEGYQSHS